MKEAFPIGRDMKYEQAYRVAFLVAGFIKENLTEKEHTELDEWITADINNQRLFEQLINPSNLDAWQKFNQKLDTNAALKRVRAKLLRQATVKKDRVFKSWWAYAAAACLLVAVFIVAGRLQPKKQNTIDNKIVTAKKMDIAPGSNKAILMLSDGEKITLDSAANGRLAMQGNTIINKDDSGLLRYQPAVNAIAAGIEERNTLSVPDGGQYKLLLPDGTKVWLNAGSSLTYPMAFSGPARKVDLTGEGYFEVAKDPMFPFEVSVNGSVVHVLGTHFNINAYSDEPVVKVSLAEGSVKLNNTMMLRPGEEAAISKNGNMLKSKADLETTLAWKDNQFIFKEANIDYVMRQVARWYNAQIIYETDSKDHFNAAIPRSVPVSKLLHLLEGTGEVHFKIEDAKIIVMK